jgi:ABC-type polysaccharide/polyol phosphate transport system ATPase subunit
MARIELDEVSLIFHVRSQGRVTLKEYLLHRLFRSAVNPMIRVDALREVSLQINAGDRLGIVGPNGAGKSALLRVIAGIYPPTRGRCIVEGSVSALFDIAQGFEMEATGWENISLRGYLQGETPWTIRSKLNEVAEFSELGHFLDLPLRTYSSGMLVRLAFSIATAIEPEVLLVDEVLSAGDLSFQEKAQCRIRDLIARASLIVMVSHDLGALSRVCTRGVWLDHGRIRLVASMAEVIGAYTNGRAAEQPAAA